MGSSELGFGCGRDFTTVRWQDKWAAIKILYMRDYDDEIIERHNRKNLNPVLALNVRGIVFEMPNSRVSVSENVVKNQWDGMKKVYEEEDCEATQTNKKKKEKLLLALNQRCRNSNTNHKIQKHRHQS